MSFSACNLCTSTWNIISFATKIHFIFDSTKLIGRNSIKSELIWNHFVN